VSFEHIYKTTFQYVYRFFYYKSVNQADIEDLEHEVYIRFYKKFDFENLPEVETKRILFGIARNVYREWVRQCIKENKAEFLDNYEYEDLIDDFVDEEFEKKIALQKQVVLEAIEKLNPTVKSVLEYRFIHAKSRKEIAELLGIKEKDVHTYQKRGIKYLRKLINNDNA